MSVTAGAFFNNDAIVEKTSCELGSENRSKKFQNNVTLLGDNHKAPTIRPANQGGTPREHKMTLFHKLNEIGKNKLMAKRAFTKTGMQSKLGKSAIDAPASQEKNTDTFRQTQNRSIGRVTKNPSNSSTLPFFFTNNKAQQPQFKLSNMTSSLSKFKYLCAQIHLIERMNGSGES